MFCLQWQTCCNLEDSPRGMKEEVEEIYNVNKWERDLKLLFVSPKIFIQRNQIIKVNMWTVCDSKHSENYGESKIHQIKN